MVAKKKLPYYLDAQGNRRDPNRKGHPILCNATSKTTGELCCNIAQANMKCRTHSGNSNERTRQRLEAKEGITADSLWYDALRKDEMELLSERRNAPRDAFMLVQEQIDFCVIKQRRLLMEINDLEDKIARGERNIDKQYTYRRRLLKDNRDKDIRIVQDDGTVLKASHMQLDAETEFDNSYEDLLQQKHDALTRTQVLMSKLIEMQFKYENVDKKGKDNGALKELSTILSKAREQRQAQIARVEEENQKLLDNEAE